MTKKSLKEMTDQELLAEIKKLKGSKITNAILIGFCVGIIVWSVAKNTLGLLSLIPLFYIYKLVNNSKKNKELEELLNERKLNKK